MPAPCSVLQAIFTHSREVDPVLVQKAIMAVMRLCLRLLPYKPHISDSLVRGVWGKGGPPSVAVCLQQHIVMIHSVAALFSAGVQLVSLVDGQVASDMAPTIASELLGLLKVRL